MKAKDLFVGDVILFEYAVARVIKHIRKDHGFLLFEFEDGHKYYFHPDEQVMASRSGRIL
jgi:hypothetical protein